MKIDKMEIEKRTIGLRQEYNIQTYGIKDIFSLIEQRGINLIRYPFGKDVLLGFSTIFEGKKVIASNSSEILSREIFTIAHELGHIVYDFEDKNQDIKIDVNISDINEDVSEARAFYFANCLLMPEAQLQNFIKFELEKTPAKLSALDIVRIQIEFNVSYSAAVKWLHEIKLINSGHKSELFEERNEKTSSRLFDMIGDDGNLLKAADIIKVPAQYYEYIISNYEKGYIPFSSLEKALGLLGKEADLFKREEVDQDEEIDIDDIFEEYE